MRLDVDNVGAIGVVRDRDPFTLPANAWTAAQNIRFTEQTVEKFTGHEQVFGAATVAPYFAMQNNKAGTLFWIYAGLNDVYNTDGSNHYNTSHASASYSTNIDIGWNGGHLPGGVAILNNGVDAPISWSGSNVSDDFAQLSNWPAGMVARVVRPFKNFLFAGDIDEGAGRDGTLLRWSHPASPGGVPTSWDYLDPNVDAGRVSISPGGFIVDMAPLGDLLMIYCETSTHAAQFTGGANKFQFRPIFDESGILSRRCVKSFFRKHLVLTLDDVILHDGHNIEQIFHEKWRRALFSSMDGTYYTRSFVAINYKKTEIWICYPESGNTLPNVALVWNWKENTQYMRELPGGTSHIAWGVVDPNISDAFNDASGAFDDATGIFDAQNYSGAQQYLLMCDTNRSLFYRADQTEQFDGIDMTTLLQREAIPLGRSGPDGQTKIDMNMYKYIQEVWPTINGTPDGVVYISIGRQKYRNDTISWTSPKPFVIGTDRKINVKASGRIISIKFESSTNITWTLSNYTIIYNTGGTR